MSRVVATVLLLVGSNVFMTIAWYGHLKFHDASRSLHLSPMKLLPVIMLAWLVALPEYMLQVPANRLGHTNFGGPLSAPQLKVIQEAITLVVFSVFSVLVLKEGIRLRDAAAFALVFIAVAISMTGRGAPLADGSP